MTPFTPKAQATRDRILASASELFHVNGYTATGLDKIIVEAKVTKGNFYYHFKSKEELVLATLDLQFEEFSTGIESAFSTSSTASEKLFGLLGQLLAIEQEHFNQGKIRGCFFGNLSLEMSTLSEPVQKKIKRIFSEFQTILRSLLEQAIEAEEIAKDIDAETFSAFILSAVEGSLLLDKTNQEPGQLAATIDFLKTYLNPPRITR
ncbi:MAG: TetR/AcrR family transcriptional regulator [Pseudomonadota bacterium]